MEKAYHIRWYWRVWFAVPLIWTIAISILTALNGIQYLLFPIPAFLLLFGTIYLFMTNFSIRFLEEDLVVVTRFVRRRIPYSSITRLRLVDRKVWVVDATQLLVEYDKPDGRSARFYLEVKLFGPETIWAIVETIISKNTTLHHDRHFFRYMAS